MSKEKAKLIEINGTKEEIAAIAEISKTAQELLDKEHNIVITPATAIPTIAYRFIFSAVKFLNDHRSKDEDVVVNLMNMIDLGVTYRDANEESEKDGNFTPFVQAGTEMKTMIKDDADTEDE